MSMKSKSTMSGIRENHGLYEGLKKTFGGITFITVSRKEGQVVGGSNKKEDIKEWDHFEEFAE